MKKILSLIVLTIAVNCLYAQTKQKVTKGTVTFQIKNMGISCDGAFSGMEADIAFDPAHPESSHIEASVSSASVNSQNTMRDDHLKEEEFFDVNKYPRISLKSILIKHKSGNNYSGIFAVTIKDKTKQLEMPFTYTETGSSGLFKGNLKLDRTDFGVGGSSMVLSKDATVSIEVETTKQ